MVVVVVVVVCYCIPTLGTSSAHSTLSRLVVHLGGVAENGGGENHVLAGQRLMSSPSSGEPYPIYYSGCAAFRVSGAGSRFR